MLLKNLNKVKPFIPTIIFIFILYILSRLIPQEEIEKFLMNAGIFAPMAFIGVTVLSHIIAPLSGTPATFVGFYLFGTQVVWMVYVASLVSVTTNFWIARKWGRGVVIKLAGVDSINKIDKYVTGKSYFYLFIVRVFLATYHDFISYAAGLTKMKFVLYFVVSALGLIPGMVIWFYLATHSEDALTFIIHTFVFAFIMIGIFALWQKRAS